MFRDGSKIAGLTRATTIVNDKEPNKQFLYSVIGEWLKSPQRKEMLEVESYYANENPPIKSSKKCILDSEGNATESKVLSNLKLAHSFIRKLVNQKIAYLLSKDFNIQASKRLSNETRAALEDKIKEFTAILNDDFFTKDFFRMLKNVGKEAIKTGCGWMQAYYDEAGNLKFMRIPANEVYAFWKDSDHTILDAVLRIYVRDYYDADGNKSEIKKVEYWNSSGVWYFQYDADGLIPDPDKPEKKSGHFSLAYEEVDEATGQKKNVIENQVWDSIPFIPFKYNSEEYGILQFIKDLVDAYDKINSEIANNIIDIPNSIKVISNYDGTDKEEFVTNMNKLRTIFVSDGGDVKSVTTPLDSAATEATLTRIRKDIFEFGGGVDTQNQDLGVASGVALKFRYADLDMDCSFFANEIAAALEKLVWFIIQDIVAKSNKDYSDVEIDFIFNTDMAINETEVINNIVNSASLLSKKTQLVYHPYVNNPDEELERLETEQEEALENAEAYNFNNPSNPDDPNNQGEEPTKTEKEPTEE